MQFNMKLYFENCHNFAITCLRISSKVIEIAVFICLVMLVDLVTDN